MERMEMERKSSKRKKEGRKGEKTLVAVEPSAPAEKRGEESLEAFLAASDEESDDGSDEESLKDLGAYEARLYRDYWNDVFSGDEFGSYDTVTSIPPMFFTDRAHDDFVHVQQTLQIFSVKVADIAEGLRWPLDVYGIVAVRDVVDHNRNIIFHRERGNCQTIFDKDAYLALTGPTRAVVVSVHPVYFEVDLKVKGATESEDYDLSFLAVSYRSCGPSASYVIDRVETSKLSTLEFTFAHIVNSVEATISVEVISGRWPVGYRGVFVAKTSSIEDMEVSLLASGDDEPPVDDDGMVKLSRRVLCVELLDPGYQKAPKLKVSVQAECIDGKKNRVKGDLSFRPKEDGRSEGTMKVVSCVLQVTVAWSLLSTFKCSYD
uniref:Uncharacterized protein n=1 Tax=Avena sativa TaxID=4498 RepID=A0ACD5TSR9_AVESA